MKKYKDFNEVPDHIKKDIEEGRAVAVPYIKSRIDWTTYAIVCAFIVGAAYMGTSGMYTLAIIAALSIYSMVTSAFLVTFSLALARTRNDLSASDQVLTLVMNQLNHVLSGFSSAEGTSPPEIGLTETDEENAN
jgi:hypothetical protein